MIEIFHCLYDVEFKQFHVRSSPHYIIPNKFIDLLIKKAKKWEKYKGKIIFFTIGHDIVNKIWAIAIVHPWDIFNQKLGEDIVYGRLNREAGILGRDTYTEITLASEDFAEIMEDKKLIIPFPDYIITQKYLELE